jgi:hypothetical protein
VEKNIDLEIWGILIIGPQAFNYGNQIGMACETTYGKRFGIRMNKNAYENITDPKQHMTKSLLRQVWQDRVITLQVTYETRDAFYKQAK